MQKLPTPKKMLVLSDELSGGHLAVGWQAFMTFSRAIEGDLDRLVAKWSGVAAPQAGRRVSPGPARGGGPRRRR